MSSESITFQPPPVPDLPEAELLRRLAEWEITAMGLHPDGSNYVFVVRLTDGDSEVYGIYKPSSGERPLRDFPYGTLHNREWAAYRIASALGWPRVPPTVIRDGPHGIGSVQLYIDADFSRHYFNERDARLDDYEPIAMFDVLVNNADRKGGACLVDSEERIWAVDHGLTFNPLARRRTVMFEFSGAAYPLARLPDLESLATQLVASDGELRTELATVLEPDEVDSLARRCAEMLSSMRFPELDPNYNVPWPIV